MPRAKIKRPVDVYDYCPNCDSRNLFSREGQVFCHFCGWDSIESWVDAGGMDWLGSVDLDKLEGVVEKKTPGQIAIGL